MVNNQTTDIPTPLPINYVGNSVQHSIEEKKNIVSFMETENVQSSNKLSVDHPGLQVGTANAGKKQTHVHNKSWPANPAKDNFIRYRPHSRGPSMELTSSITTRRMYGGSLSRGASLQLNWTE